MGYGISEYPEFVLKTLLELEKKQKEPQAGVLKTDLHLAFCGTFDPREFHDRYEEASAELVRAKLDGRPIEVPKAPEETKVVNLMDALRKSAGLSGRGTEGAKAKTGRTRATRSKAKPGTSKTKRRASGEASHRRKAG